MSRWLWNSNSGRGYCGDCLLWWRVEGKGYTCDLDYAWKVTEEKAAAICRDRPAIVYRVACLGS